MKPVKVALRPDAEADVRAAVEYYDAAETDLRDGFIDELDRLLLRLSEFPRSAQRVQGFDAVRRALLRRFPFAVFYAEEEDQIVVLRVTHTARSTETWPKE